MHVMKEPREERAEKPRKRKLILEYNRRGMHVIIRKTFIFHLNSGTDLHLDYYNTRSSSKDDNGLLPTCNLLARDRRR